MRIGLVGLTLAALLGTPTRSARCQAADRWQPVRDSIRKQILNQNAAALAVAVAKDGKIIWEEGFGWANREKMIPATPNTMFSLASISKPITATGLMLLVQRGLVNLDRPANDYLGSGRITGLAGPAEGATVRRVLSHTAGLPLHYQFFYANEGIRPPTMDETITRYGNLVSAPGEVFRYSNLGFGIIDYIISRTSGTSYPDFMRNEVFLPLGLTHTSIDIGPGLEPFAAERYDDRGRPVPFYTFDHNGGSAVYSSAHDLVRFGMFHLKDHLPDQRPILADSTLDQMHRGSGLVAFGDSGAFYSLGWINHKSDHGVPSFEHTGGMPGVATALNLYPTENLAVTVLSNGGGDPFSIAQDIAAILIPRYADSLKADRARKRNNDQPKFAPPPDLVGKWTGTLRTWKQTQPFNVTIEADGDVKVQIDKATEGDRAQLWVLLNNTKWDGTELTGEFQGTIPTSDASRVPHTITVELRRANGKLRGQVVALSNTDIVYFALASYAELTRH